LDPLGTFERQLYEISQIKLPASLPLPQPAGIGGGASIEELLRISYELDEQRKESNKTLDAARKATEAYQKSVKDLRDELSGAKLQGEVRKLQDAFDALSAKQKTSADVMGRVGEAADRLRESGATLTPKLWEIVVATGHLAISLDTGAGAFERIGREIEVTIPQADRLAGLLPQVTVGVNDLIGAMPKLDLGYQFERATTKAAETHRALGELSAAFAQLATIAGGSIGSIVQSLGTLIGALNTVDKGIDSFKAGKSAFSAGDVLSGIAGMTTGILGIASAAFAAGKALAGLFDRNKGRDLVVDFAETFGGFDALQQKLVALGPEYDRLWRNLTQLSNNNDQNEARRAIDAVTEALNRQKTTLEDTGVVAATTSDGFVASQREAIDAIAALDNQIKGLEASIANEAPEEVMGIIEANTRAQIDAIVKERTAAQAALDDVAIQSAEAGREAGDIIDQALAEREFHIKVKVDLEGLPGGTVPALANGGIVRRRTLALVGESGPEAVIPLNQMGRGFGGTPNLDITLRLPNNQVLLRQFVKGLQAEGLA